MTRAVDIQGLHKSFGDLEVLKGIDLAVDSQGNVYVADVGNTRVQKFDSEGKFLAKWTTCTGPTDYFIDPGGVATDAQGNAYISDWTKNRICKFDSNGTFLNVWGETGDGNGHDGGSNGGDVPKPVRPLGPTASTGYGGSEVQ